jgi:hypothetical protein
MQIRSSRNTLCILAGILLSCTSMSSEQSALGTYTMASRGSLTTLWVCADHTFTQEVVRPGKPKYRYRGRWKWRPGYLDFDKLWIPIEFIPQGMMDFQSPDLPRLSDPSDASLGAEIRFGRRILEVFPDSETNFNLTRSESAKSPSRECR